MKKNERDLLLGLGVLLFLEGIFLSIDWVAYGIPSIYLGGIHIHHWLIGLAIIVWIGLMK